MEGKKKILKVTEAPLGKKRESFPTSYGSVLEGSYSFLLMRFLRGKRQGTPEETEH